MERPGRRDPCSAGPAVERRTPRTTASAASCSRSSSTSARGSDQHDFILTLALRSRPVRAAAARRSPGQATEAGWRERVPALEQTVGPRDARHAYAVLAGLTSRSGGMVAAATMSLPERARGRAATTTTATSGFATSVMRAAPSPRPAPTRCSTTPSAFVRATASRARPRPQARLHDRRAAVSPTNGSSSFPGTRAAASSSGTGSTSSSSSTSSAKRYCSSPPLPNTTAWTRTAGEPRRSPQPRSQAAGGRRTPGSGNSNRTHGRTAG